MHVEIYPKYGPEIERRRSTTFPVIVQYHPVYYTLVTIFIIFHPRVFFL